MRTEVKVSKLTPLNVRALREIDLPAGVLVSLGATFAVFLGTVPDVAGMIRAAMTAETSRSLAAVLRKLEGNDPKFVAVTTFDCGDGSEAAGGCTIPGEDDYLGEVVLSPSLPAQEGQELADRYPIGAQVRNTITGRRAWVVGTEYSPRDGARTVQIDYRDGSAPAASSAECTVPEEEFTDDPRSSRRTVAGSEIVPGMVVLTGALGPVTVGRIFRVGENAGCEGRTAEGRRVELYLPRNHRITLVDSPEQLSLIPEGTCPGPQRSGTDCSVPIPA